MENQEETPKLKVSKTRKLKKKDYGLLPYQNENEIEIGIDEAGAGTFFGSLFVAGVILPKNIKEIMDNDNEIVIRDSKKMTQKKRDYADEFIKRHALEWFILEKTNQEVDECNILQARLQGFHEVVHHFELRPTKILVDGDKFLPYINNTTHETIPHECVIEGDNMYLSIAAASILAKTAQIRHIEHLVSENKEYRKYDIHNNHGYGTSRHLYAIKEFGVTPYHRLSFGICRKYSNGRFEEREKINKNRMMMKNQTSIKPNYKEYLFHDEE
jgi:ribonuclease HII